MMLELVNGKPPYLGQPINEVVFSILTYSAPDIEEDFKWSLEMRDFLKICLVKDPFLRPSTEELINHPFLTKESSPKEIEKARGEFLKILLPFREEKAK
jgi:serine/threonine protein kinase